MEENLPPNPAPTPPPVESNVPPPLHSSPPPPPPPPRPPVIAAFAPTPTPRRCGAWKIVALILFLGLALSMWLNMKSYARHFIKTSSVRHKRQMLEEVLVEDNSSKYKIAVVEINGVIHSGDHDRRGHSLVDGIREQLEAAADDPTVKAIVLKVNSPGGEVLASDEIYNSIQNFQATTKKPVVASMQTLAASGGYYVAAPCRWIVANELTLTGSIGVIMHGWNFSSLMDKIGVRAETYKSGDYKDMLSPFRREDEISPKEKEMVQSLIMETYGKFTNIVASGRDQAYAVNRKAKNLDDRGNPLADEWTDYADGRVLSGQQAYDLGFVDELGDFEVAIVRAQKLALISNANLIEYRQPFDFGDFFGLLGQSQSRSVKIDIGVEFPKLQPGCLYFLYRQAVP